MALLIRDIDETALLLRRLYSSHGYKKYSMSKFEPLEFYSSNKAFLEDDRVVTFSDFSGRLMALRPDVTLSIVKNAVRSGESRVCYCENVYRGKKGSPAVEEIKQAGLEHIGAIDAATQCTVVSLAADSLKLISDKWVLDVSHLGFADAALNEAGCSEELRSEIVSCIASKAPHGILKLCAENGIAETSANKLAALAELSGPINEVLDRIDRISTPPYTDAYILELKELSASLRSSGTDGGINLDFSVVNDMNYYNGIVFRGYADGLPVCALSGGRYDRLVKKFGINAGGLGFAVYLGRIEPYIEEGGGADA